MVLVVGIALTFLAVPLMVYDISARHQRIEGMAKRLANAALDMLATMHFQPFIHDGNSENIDPPIDILDDTLEQFSEINQDVTLWLVMGSKVLDYQETGNRGFLKRPLDEIDAEVIKTGKPKMALDTDDILRVSRPVLLGQGRAGEQRCVSCHSELMQWEPGDVIGAYSAAVDLELELAAWRRGMFAEIGAVILIEVIALALAFYLLKAATLRPLHQLAEMTNKLANGDAQIEIRWKERVDEIGIMARSLDVFRANLIEKIDSLETQKQQFKTTLDKERELIGLQRQFVSMVSHEFRTPLTIIDGSAQRLTKHPSPIASDHLESVVQTIRSAVVRLVDLTESILRASHSGGETVGFKPQPCDIIEMIQEVCTSYHEVNPDRRIRLDLRRLPSSFYLDASLMRQVLSNLVSNAIQYTPDGTRIWVHGKATADGDMVISVRDDGPGIPADELECLFERFFRGSASAGVMGAGNGLHFVRAYVELHGGLVNVTSAEGEGTTFTINLPSSEATATCPDKVA